MLHFLYEHADWLHEGPLGAHLVILVEVFEGEAGVLQQVGVQTLQSFAEGGEISVQDHVQVLRPQLVEDVEMSRSSGRFPAN